MKRYRVIKIKRNDFRVVVIAPDDDVAVVSGFRRKTDALMWIVEDTMETRSARTPPTPEPGRDD